MACRDVRLELAHSPTDLERLHVGLFRITFLSRLLTVMFCYQTLEDGVFAESGWQNN